MKNSKNIYQVGFCVYRRSYSMWPPVIILLRGTIVNRTKYCQKKWLNIYLVGFFMYTIGPINYGPP